MYLSKNTVSMISTPTHAKAALILCGLGLLVLCGFTLQEHIPSMFSDTKTSSRGYWHEKITSLSGSRAYEILADSVRTKGVSMQHEEAHLFGAALYEVEGVSSLAVCDERFSYGCFHEFLGRAIAELGLDSVPDLNAQCIQALGPQALSCQHGIGHGIQAAVGYTTADLEQSLSVCDTLPHQDPIGGCYSGVFMEYNLRIMLAKEASPRTYSGNVFEPCDDLGTRYQAACVFSQPQWWLQTVLQPTEKMEAFRTMGRWCEDSETFMAGGLRHCFEGIGNIVVEPAHYDGARVAALCDETSSIKTHALLCRSMGASALSATKTDTEALKACASLSGEYLSFCESYAHNESNILEVRALPAL